MSDLLLDEHSLWHSYITSTEFAFLKEVARFVEKEVVPYADEWEANEALPREIFNRAGEIGLMGISVPVALGGQGMGYVAYALAIREIAKASASLALDVAAHNTLAVGHILLAGNSAQHSRVFPGLANGEWVGAWALTEPEAGSDSSGVQTTAVESPDGSWELNGLKRFITSGRTADILVVIATTGTNEKGRKEISAFLVDKGEVQPIRKIGTCGMRASETSEFRLVKGKGELLGLRGAGQAGALACLDKGRIGVAAVSLGLARAALDGALRHAVTRRQFGKRLADFQGMQFMVADCETDLHAANLLVLQAAILASKGIPHGKESAVAKLFASEAASRICNRSLQIHGGLGYSSDVPIERYWRDARLCEIGEGSSEVQRIVISRSLLKSIDESQASVSLAR